MSRSVIRRSGTFPLVRSQNSSGVMALILSESSFERFFCVTSKNSFAVSTPTTVYSPFLKAEIASSRVFPLESTIIILFFNTSSSGVSSSGFSASSSPTRASFFSPSSAFGNSSDLTSFCSSVKATSGLATSASGASF